MDSKKINIVIIGEVAAGKSTIAQLVKEVLDKKGFKSVVHSPDEVDNLPKSLRTKRLEAVVAKQPSINILVIQAKTVPKLNLWEGVVIKK